MEKQKYHKSGILRIALRKVPKEYLLLAAQISSYFVDAATNVTLAQNGTETAVTRTCMDTCDSERWADALSTTYQQTTCNLLLPTYTSSAAAFPCKSAVLPRSILQGFAIVTAQAPAAS